MIFDLFAYNWSLIAIILISFISQREINTESVGNILIHLVFNNISNSRTHFDSYFLWLYNGLYSHLNTYIGKINLEME